MKPRPAIQTLRLTAAIEGLSWLVLIGAMIYRSLTGHHEPVRWAGTAHGGLFCAFCLALLITWIAAGWSLRFTLLIGLSSLIPTGFLFAEPHLRRKLAQHD